MNNLNELFSIVLECIPQHQLRETVIKIPELTNPSFLNTLFSQAYDKHHYAGLEEINNGFKSMLYDYIELRKSIEDNTHSLIKIYDTKGFDGNQNCCEGYKLVEKNDANYPIGFNKDSNGVDFIEVVKVI